MIRLFSCLAEGEGTESTEEDEGSRPQAAMTSAEARGTLFGALGGTDPKADVAKAAGVAQLGSLPMQPPPLNLNNFAAAYLGQIPGLPNLTNMGPIPLGTPAGDPQMTTNPAPPAAPEGPAQ